MKKLLLRYAVLIALIVINLGLAAFLALNFKQFANRNSEFNSLKNKVADFKKAKRIISDFKQAEATQEEEILKKKIPVDSIIPLEAIKEVKKIADKLGIQEIIISFKEKGRRASLEVPGVEILPLEVKLSCEYNKIIDFLKELPQAPCLINAVELKISHDPSKLFNLDAILTLDSYTVLSKKEVPAQVFSGSEE